MGRVFAVGDIHGCSHTFVQMVLEEMELQKSDVLYCLGDYVDRGKDSKGVIDFIFELRESGHTIHTLRGNHEQIMMDSVKSREAFMLWAINGGTETLKSFGVHTYDELPAQYRAFFEQTEYYRVHDRHIFAHAGLNFKNADPFEDKEAMLWIRGFKIDKKQLGDGILVHGHTPIPLEMILAQAGESEINIDGGCVYEGREGLGNLVGYEIEGKFLVVENVDR